MVIIIGVAGNVVGTVRIGKLRVGCDAGDRVESTGAGNITGVVAVAVIKVHRLDESVLVAVVGCRVVPEDGVGNCGVVRVRHLYRLQSCQRRCSL